LSLTSYSHCFELHHLHHRLSSDSTSMARGQSETRVLLNRPMLCRLYLKSLNRCSTTPKPPEDLPNHLLFELDEHIGLFHLHQQQRDRQSAIYCHSRLADSRCSQSFPAEIRWPNSRDSVHATRWKHRVRIVHRAYDLRQRRSGPYPSHLLRRSTDLLKLDHCGRPLCSGESDFAPPVAPIEERSSRRLWAVS
jgi:hypothetical protein